MMVKVKGKVRGSRVINTWTWKKGKQKSGLDTWAKEDTEADIKSTSPQVPWSDTWNELISDERVFAYLHPPQRRWDGSDSLLFTIMSQISRALPASHREEHWSVYLRGHA